MSSRLDFAWYRKNISVYLSLALFFLLDALVVVIGRRKSRAKEMLQVFRNPLGLPLHNRNI